MTPCSLLPLSPCTPVHPWPSQENDQCSAGGLVIHSPFNTNTNSSTPPPPRSAGRRSQGGAARPSPPRLLPLQSQGGGGHALPSNTTLAGAYDHDGWTVVEMEVFR